MRNPKTDLASRSSRFGTDLPLIMILITCSQASKKKNLDTIKVLTSMTELAPTTLRRAIMFMTRMTLSTT